MNAIVLGMVICPASLACAGDAVLRDDADAADVNCAKEGIVTPAFEHRFSAYAYADC